MQKPPITRSEPDETGHWGKFGGRYVPETLVAPLEELTKEFTRARNDPHFWRDLNQLLRDYCGRPTPLFHAQRLTAQAGGAQIYLKREDLLHTGAHKINNAMGQVLLAGRMGKHRIIAETGAGQHGVATATVCALFGLRCIIYMGAEDARRQALNVFRMRLLGAEVVTVNAGTRTLKDAINEALRDWVTNVHDTYYLLGSALGPHPYPLMVREFQSVIGREAREQILSATGKLPRALIACVGGGSNSIGLFHPFIADEQVRLIGVEAGGRGDSLGEHAARFHSGAASRGGFIPFITAGDPDLATTELLLIELAAAGADVIELGVPFSDPVADGEVIQRASERALRNGVTLHDALTRVAHAKQHIDVPIVLFSYFNPLLKFGEDRLANEAKQVGIDAVLVTDLIPEEAPAWIETLCRHELDPIFLVAPTTSDERVARIARQARGFIYAVSRAGVTGARDEMTRDAETLVKRVRSATDLPVAVGFGVSSAEQVREVWRFADAAVVGSAIVREIERLSAEADLVDRVGRFARSLLAPKLVRQEVAS